VRLRRFLAVLAVTAALFVAGIGGGSHVAAIPFSPMADIRGDANCDTNADSIDALLVLQFNAALIPSLPCPENADYDFDGDIDAIDAALILQFEAGLFP
jgi:hypothetical protein